MCKGGRGGERGISHNGMFMELTSVLSVKHVPVPVYNINNDDHCHVMADMISIASNDCCLKYKLLSSLRSHWLHRQQLLCSDLLLWV